MGLVTLRFISLLSAVVALGPAFAHLLELRVKIRLPLEQYRIVQQLYRGWALIGVAVVTAIFSTLGVAFLVRAQRQRFALTLIAFLLLIGTQIIFWAVTFPVNQRTRNWTVFPPDWKDLRLRWEYSHAAGAVLNLIVVVVLILSVVA